MMFVKVKCAICKQEFYRDLEPAVKKNQRLYAHAACYPQGIPYVPILTQEQIKEELARQQLCEYIVQKHGLKSCGPTIYTQIKRLHDNYNFTYSGMLGTLMWYYDVKGYPVTNPDSIMLVTKWYAEAKWYYEALRDKQQTNENKQIADYILPTEEVEIISPRAKVKKVKLFNLDDEEVEN